jgi:hypothetical protein
MVGIIFLVRAASMRSAAAAFNGAAAAMARFRYNAAAAFALPRRVLRMPPAPLTAYFTLPYRFCAPGALSLDMCSQRDARQRTNNNAQPLTRARRASLGVRTRMPRSNASCAAARTSHPGGKHAGVAAGGR